MAKLKVPKQDVFTKPALPPPNALKRKQQACSSDAVVQKVRKGRCFRLCKYWIDYVFSLSSDQLNCKDDVKYDHVFLMRIPFMQ